MRAFLRAEWRHLLMLNYPVEPELLKPFIPRGTELDDWNGVHQFSMVGFLFLRTRVVGLPVPLHINFEEVNLRFYVRRRAPDGWRRGVVFIKEIVPRRLIAAVARACYDEPYVATTMRHKVDLQERDLSNGGNVEYGWRWNGRWNSISATVAGGPFSPPEDSEEAFITEHYWGYTARRDGRCSEYRVEHPRWNVYRVKNPALDCAVRALYGERFVGTLASTPRSAFVADGSPVAVGFGSFLG